MHLKVRNHSPSQTGTSRKENSLLYPTPFHRHLSHHSSLSTSFCLAISDQRLHAVRFQLVMHLRRTRSDWRKFLADSGVTSSTKSSTGINFRSSSETTGFEIHIHTTFWRQQNINKWANVIKEFKIDISQLPLSLVHWDLPHPSQATSCPILPMLATPTHLPNLTPGTLHAFLVIHPKSIFDTQSGTFPYQMPCCTWVYSSGLLTPVSIMPLCPPLGCPAPSSPLTIFTTPIKGNK